MVRKSARFSTSQILTSPLRAGKPPAAASSLPSGENATARTSSASPGSVPTTLPVSRFHQPDFFERAQRQQLAIGAVRQRADERLHRVRGLISGIAGARFATTSPGSRRLRPGIDPLADVSISPSASFLPVSGMAGVTCAGDPQIQKALAALARHNHRPAMAAFLQCL
jgi:hypothetical protein